MAPPKSKMPMVLDQISKLKRLNHGALSTQQLLNSINPDDMRISYAVIF